MGDCDRYGRTDVAWKNYHQFKNIDDPLLASYAMGLLKENLDDIDFYLTPILEVLHELGLIDEQFYKRIKYGAEDDVSINLIKFGADPALAKILVSDYELKMNISIEDGTIVVDKDSLLKKMRDRKIPFTYRRSVELLF